MSDSSPHSHSGVAVVVEELWSIPAALESARAGARSALAQALRTVPTLGPRFSAAFEATLPDLLASVAAVMEAEGGQISKAALDKLTSELSLRAMLSAGRAENAAPQSAAANVTSMAGASSTSTPTNAATNAATAAATTATTTSTASALHHSPVPPPPEAAFFIAEAITAGTLAATGLMIKRIHELPVVGGGGGGGGSSTGIADSGSGSGIGLDDERTRMITSLETILRTLALIHDARGVLNVPAALLRTALFPELCSEKVRIAIWETKDIEKAKVFACAHDPLCILHFIKAPPIPMPMTQTPVVSTSVIVPPRTTTIAAAAATTTTDDGVTAAAGDT